MGGCLRPRGPGLRYPVGDRKGGKGRERRRGNGQGRRQALGYCSEAEQWGHRFSGWVGKNI